MNFLRMEKCCGVIDLQTGSRFAAYFNLVEALLLIIRTIIDLDFAIKLSRLTRSGIAAFPGVYMCSLILFLASALILLRGLRNNKVNLVNAYLMYALVFAAIMMIYSISYAILFQENYIPIVSERIVFDLIFIILTVYSVLVVYNHYCQIKNVFNGPAVNTASEQQAQDVGEDRRREN